MAGQMEDQTIVYLETWGESAKRITAFRRNRNHLCEGPALRNASQDSTFVRLDFESTQKPSPREFTFGNLPENYIIMIPRSEDYTPWTLHSYFHIQYNFNSGALMITADKLPPNTDPIRIGDEELEAEESRVLENWSFIECGLDFVFVVRFPPRKTPLNPARNHQTNYLSYVGRLGVEDAHYLGPQGDRYGIDFFAPYDRYEDWGFLGRSSSGLVHKAVHRTDGTTHAIKRMVVGKDGKREIKTLRRLHHGNIIAVRDSFESHPDRLLYMVMDLAICNLDNYLDTFTFFSQHCICTIAWQTLSALEYLHSQKYTHGDIKPMNILVTGHAQQYGTPIVQLSGFGEASQGTAGFVSWVGTDGYRAPEIQRVAEFWGNTSVNRDEYLSRAFRNPEFQRMRFYTNKVDIWSLGLVLDKCLHKAAEMHTWRVEGNELASKMRSMLPSERPSATECLKSRWVRKYCRPGNLPQILPDVMGSPSGSVEDTDGGDAE